MESTINTGGFDVGVMPHYTAPDPSLVAKYNPNPYIQGSLAGISIADQAAKLQQYLAVQPSQTASEIAGNQQSAAQSDALKNLPLGGLPAKQGDLPLSTKTEFNPATNSLDTNAYLPGKDGSQQLYKTLSQQQAPSGEVIHTTKTVGGNTQVTQEQYVSTVPGQPATIWDEGSGQEIVNPLAKVRQVGVKTNTLQNPRIYGDAALEQQMVDASSALATAKSKTQQDFWQSRIDEIKEVQQSHLDEARAKAAKEQADAAKASGANDTILKRQELANQGSLATTNAKTGSAEKIAGQRIASAEKLETQKEASRFNELTQKEGTTWSQNELNNAYKLQATYARDLVSPGLSDDAKSDVQDRITKLDKQIQAREAFQQNAQAQAATSTVKPGAQANAPAPTPEFIAYLKSNPTPENVSSWDKKYGQGSAQAILSK